MTKKQHYMTPNERQKLEALREEGISVSRIAKRLGFCRQTIYNEIKRGQYDCVKERHGYYRDEVHYSADKAQQKHDYAQTGKAMLTIGSPGPRSEGGLYHSDMYGHIVQLHRKGRISKSDK